MARILRQVIKGHGPLLNFAEPGFRLLASGILFLVRSHGEGFSLGVPVGYSFSIPLRLLFINSRTDEREGKNGAFLTTFG